MLQAPPGNVSTPKAMESVIVTALLTFPAKAVWVAFNLTHGALDPGL